MSQPRHNKYALSPVGASEEFPHWAPFMCNRLRNSLSGREVLFADRSHRDGWLRTAYGPRKAAALLSGRKRS